MSISHTLLAKHQNAFFTSSSVLSLLKESTTIPVHTSTHTHTHTRIAVIHIPACNSPAAHIMSRSHFLHRILWALILSSRFFPSLFPSLSVVFLHTQHLGSAFPCFQNKHRLILDVWILRAWTHTRAHILFPAFITKK